MAMADDGLFAGTQATCPTCEALAAMAMSGSEVFAGVLPTREARAACEAPVVWVLQL